MKKNLLIITLLAIFSLSANAQTSEILLGGFEGDTVENVWLFWEKPASISEISVVTHQDSVHSGSQSIRARFNGTATQGGIAVKPSTSYVITGWGLGATQNSKYKVILYAENDGVKGEKLAESFHHLPDPGWTFIQSEFAIPELVDSVQVALTNPRNNVDDFTYFDDISIMEGIADLKAPLAPDTCLATFVDDDSVRIAWPIAIDSIGSGIQDAYMYRVFRDGEEIATTMDTTYLDETVEAYTTYLYQVSSVDMMHNEGDTTNICSVLTVPVAGVSSYLLDEFRMYPNPAKSHITLSDLPLDSEIKIYSIIGKIVYREQVIAKTMNLSISELPKGIYLVKVENYRGEKAPVQKLLID